MLNAECLRKRRKKISKKRDLSTETNFNILPDDLHNCIKKKKKQPPTSPYPIINSSNITLSFKSNIRPDIALTRDHGDSNCASVDIVDIHDVYRNEFSLLNNDSSESIIEFVQKPQALPNRKKNQKSKTKHNRDKLKNQLAPSVELLPITRLDQLFGQFQNFSTSTYSINKSSSKDKHSSNNSIYKITKKMSKKFSSRKATARNSKHSNLEKNCPKKSISIKLPCTTNLNPNTGTQKSKKSFNNNIRYTKESETLFLKQSLKAALEEENRLTLKPREYGLLGKIWENQSQGNCYL